MSYAVVCRGPGAGARVEAAAGAEAVVKWQAIPIERTCLVSFRVIYALAFHICSALTGKAAGAASRHGSAAT